MSLNKKAQTSQEIMYIFRLLLLIGVAIFIYFIIGINMTVGYDVQKISSFSFHNRVLYSGVFYSHDYDNCGFTTNAIVLDKFTNDTINKRFGYQPSSQKSNSQYEKVNIAPLPLAAKLTLDPLNGGFKSRTIYFQNETYSALLNQYRVSKGSNSIQLSKSNSLVTVYVNGCKPVKGILTMEVIAT